MSTLNKSVFALCLVLSSPAAAETTVQASLGYGLEVAPELGDRQEPNLMVALGFGLAGLIRGELGLVAAYPDGGDITPGGQIQLRPMIIISPPLLPLYLRGTLAVKSPFSDDRVLAYGASLGVSLSLAGLGVFAEAGALPITDKSDTLRWLLEARAGASLEF